MKRLNFKLLFLPLAATALSLTSCQEKDYYENGNKNQEQPSLNSYSTVQNVQFNMKYRISEGYMAGFDVYAENPLKQNSAGDYVLKSGIEPIAAGIYESGEFSMTKSIPGYIKELYAYSEDLFAPMLMHATITNGVATFEIVDMTSDETRSTRSTQNGTLDYYLYKDAGLNASHKPSNIHHTNVIDAQILTTINKAFPETNPASDLHLYIREASMEITKTAELWVTALKTGCSKRNTLGYFCYDGPKSDITGKKITDFNEKQIVVIPWAKIQESDPDGLQIGEYYQLKYYDKKTDQYVNEFPAGTTVVWFLYTDSYDSNTQTVKANTGPKFYSVPSWNPEGTGVSHTAYYTIDYKGTNFTCFAFEDQLLTSSDKDYNDLIFHVETNPANAIAPPPTIEVGDEYTSRTEPRKGILAFEDNWPSTGDYDLNDVVVRYTSNVTYTVKLEASASTRVTRIEDTFEFIHSGADLNNGFAYKINFDPSRFSVTVNGNPVTPVKDGSGYVIKICDNVLPNNRYQIGCTPEVYTVVMAATYDNSRLTQKDFQSVAAPYNPYIIPLNPNKPERTGIEVHLPMYEHTSTADLSYFKTEADASDLANKIYYVAGETVKYPFAIHLSGITTFAIPTERSTIDVSYPKYNNWVQSNFQTDQDWYVK